MENQALFNLIVGIAGFFGALWVMSVKADHKELKEDFKKHKDESVRRGDFDRAVDEIKRLLEQFFERLDRKADK